MTVHINALFIASIIGAIAAITIIIALDTARSRRMTPLRVCPWCTDLWSDNPEACTCTEKCAALECEAPGTGACPWCDDRACGLPALCDCTGPCGRRYCMATETETVQ